MFRVKVERVGAAGRFLPNVPYHAKAGAHAKAITKVMFLCQCLLTLLANFIN